MFNVSEVVTIKHVWGFALDFGKILWYKEGSYGVAYLEDEGGDVFKENELIKDPLAGLLYG